MTDDYNHDDNTFSIRLRPIPASTSQSRYTQDHANDQTQIDLKDLLPQDHPSTIVGVSLNGTVYKHRTIETSAAGAAGIVAVAPLIRLEGGYLVVKYLCPMAAEGLYKGTQRPAGIKPPQEPTYGFTAPASLTAPAK